MEGDVVVVVVHFPFVRLPILLSDDSAWLNISVMTRTRKGRMDPLTEIFMVVTNFSVARVPARGETGGEERIIVKMSNELGRVVSFRQEQNLQS